MNQAYLKWTLRTRAEAAAEPLKTLPAHRPEEQPSTPQERPMIRTRRKGANYERTIAHVLATIWPAAKRGFQFRNGREQPDVIGTPYHVECKHRRIVSIQAAMRQAIDDGQGKTPVVVSRDNHGCDLVTMRLTDWLGLHRKGAP